MTNFQSESPIQKSSPSEASTSGSSALETPPRGTPSNDTTPIKSQKDSTPPITENVTDESAKDEECEPCKEVRFAFGRTGEYFLAIQDKERFGWVYHLNSTIAQSFKTLSFAQPVYSVAIEPDGGIHIAAMRRASENPDPLCSHCGFTGLVATSYELVYKRMWQKISDEYCSSGETLSHVNITLGPRGSYFCTVKDGFFHRDIPSSLISKLNSAGINPRQVALGRGQAWVALWKDGTFSYNLGSNYPDLAEKLHKRTMANDKIAFIALNPYDDDSWFMVDCDGFCSWSFKELEQDHVDAVDQLTMSYIQRRSRRTGESYTSTRTRGSKTLSTQITPETSHDGFPESITQPARSFAGMGLRMRDNNSIDFPRVLKRPDVIAGGAAGISSTLLCRALRVKMGTALNVGVILGGVTFAAVSKYTNG